MRIKKLSFIFVALMFTTIGCSDKDDINTMSESGRLTVRLTDAPFPFDLVAEANVTIFKIEARGSIVPDATTMEDSETANDGKHFVVLSEDEMQVNLLDLSNGITKTLVDMDVPAGSYDQIRIYVKGVNVVMNDGTQYDLKVPSGEQTGIKVFIDPALEVNGQISGDVLLDFDVSRSFVVKGNMDTPAGIKGFNFKPVIRASNETTAGTITGAVTTVNANGESISVEGATVGLWVNGEEFTTVETNDKGQYTILGVPAGAYSITISKEGYVTSESDGEVQIIAGQLITFDVALEVETVAEQTGG